MSERAVDQALALRVGCVGAGEAIKTVTAIIGRIRERFGIDMPVPWWESKDHPDYELVFTAFVQPHRGLVRLADVDADPLSFDQALRELKVCRACSAHRLRVVDGKVVGVHDCPLGQEVQLETGRTHSDGRPEVVYVKPGPIGWYSDIQWRGSRWEWVMRQCTDPGERVREVRERLGETAEVAGSWAREVYGHPTPPNQPNGGAS